MRNFCDIILLTRVEVYLRKLLVFSHTEKFPKHWLNYWVMVTNVWLILLISHMFSKTSANSHT